MLDWCRDVDNCSNNLKNNCLNGTYYHINNSQYDTESCNMLPQFIWDFYCRDNMTICEYHIVIEYNCSYSTNYQNFIYPNNTNIYPNNTNICQTKYYNYVDKNMLVSANVPVSLNTSLITMMSISVILLVILGYVFPIVYSLLYMSLNNELIRPLPINYFFSDMAIIIATGMCVWICGLLFGTIDIYTIVVYLTFGAMLIIITITESLLTLKVIALSYYAILSGNYGIVQYILVLLLLPILWTSSGCIMLVLNATRWESVYFLCIGSNFIACSGVYIMTQTIGIWVALINFFMTMAKINNPLKMVSIESEDHNDQTYELDNLNSQVEHNN